jgi:hypothetical protein
VQEDDYLLHLLPVGMEEVLQEVGDQFEISAYLCRKTTISSTFSLSGWRKSFRK